MHRPFVGYGPTRHLTAIQPAMYSSNSIDKHDSDQPVDIQNPFTKERKQCILCAMKITPNYKNVRLLSQFQSPFTGRIYGRHITGLCRAKQEKVEKEIIKAQTIAFMPTYMKSPMFLKCPKLFDPERPIRPHKY